MPSVGFRGEELPGCSTSDNGYDTSNLAINTVGDNMLVIERAIFSQTDKDVWQLALVGDKEFITQDLCGSSYGCDYSADNFQKLVEDNSYFDRVDDNTKKLIIQSNEYFGGSNVVVYDQSNLELEPDLNSLALCD